MPLLPSLVASFSKRIYFIIFLFCVYEYFAVCVFFGYMCAVPTESRRGIRAPETEITDSCELPAVLGIKADAL